mmetsp:Transcript_4778/g.21813  ORF Transcript_4778/g.21813 Transcript_4778/m.21813 type:complete len:309 (-) Transcript_4778:154-1080(-)
MEQAIKQIADDFGQPVEELLSVVLDNMCQSQNVVGLDGLAACEELSIQGCGIASLDNFPNLQALRKLLLADNRIGGGLENLAKLTNLEELSIGGNKIASLDELKPLEGLKLTAIDLEGCPCADGSDTYRKALFALFPTLIFLDGTDVDGNERLIDDDDDDEDEDEENENEPASASRRAIDATKTSRRRQSHGVQPDVRLATGQTGDTSRPEKRRLEAVDDGGGAVELEDRLGEWIKRDDELYERILLMKTVDVDDLAAALRANGGDKENAKEHAWTKKVPRTKLLAYLESEGVAVVSTKSRRGNKTHF